MNPVGRTAAEHLPPDSAIAAESHSDPCANFALPQPGSFGERMRSWGAKGKALVAAAALAASLAASLAACEGAGEPVETAPNTDKTEEVVPGQTPPATVETAPVPPPAALSAVEKAAPELRPGELSAVAAALGWEGLAKAPLAILERYSTLDAEVVILTLEGTKPPANLVGEFKAALAVAERVSSYRPSFKGRNWKLGGETARDIPFTLEPSKPSGDKTAQRYVIYTGSEDPAKLQPPKAVAGPATHKSPDKSFGVAILPHTPGQTPEGHNANEVNAFIEAFRLATDARIAAEFEAEFAALDLGGLPNPHAQAPTREDQRRLLTNTGRHMVASSWALARQHARNGSTHHDYARQHTVPVRTETNTVGALCYNLPETTYPALSYPV